MPIRINLLAEEQAAEEMRKRDPIKRAVIIGSALVVLMICWIGLTQLNVGAARSELAEYESRLKKIDESSKQVRANQLLVGEIDSKIRLLEKYSTNRFFWGTFMDAMQQVAVPNMRLMEIKAEQKYVVGEVNKLFTTNITVKYTPPPAWWKFWASAGPQAQLPTLVSNAFPTITNTGPFATNVVPYTVKITPTLTNAVSQEIIAKTEFSNVPWAIEQIVIEIRGRDYGNPPGAAIDEFSRRITKSPFFQEWFRLPPRFTERPPQPRSDPQDPMNPNALFLPFTIELIQKERVLTNE